jgi:hypothetical protein
VKVLRYCCWAPICLLSTQKPVFRRSELVGRELGIFKDQHPGPKHNLGEFRVVKRLLQGKKKEILDQWRRRTHARQDLCHPRYMSPSSLYSL